MKLRNTPPGAYCAGTAALSLANGAKHHHIGLWLFVVYGAYVGWVYLRHFQRTVEDLRGAGAGSARACAWGTIARSLMSPRSSRAGAKVGSGP